MPYCAPTTDPDSDTTSNNTVFFDSEPPPTAMSDPTVPVPAPAAPSLQDLLQAIQQLNEKHDHAQQQLRDEFNSGQQKRDQAIADLQAFARAATATSAPAVVPASPVPTAVPAAPLALDSESIGDHRKQYAYLFARMTVEAQNLVVAYFEQGLLNDTGPHQFLEYLDSIFIDPFAADRALFHLDNMRQGPSEPFALFLPRFEKVLQDANIIGDRNRISKLQTAMAPALRQAMVYVNVPATYPEFTNCMQNVASKAEQFLPRPRRGHYSAFTDNTTYSPYAAHPVSPAPAGPFVSSVPPSAAARHPDAMDWTPTVTATALQPLTDEERERLRRNRACFRCRQTGHLRQNCPLNFVPTTTVPVRSTNLPQLAAPTPALPLPVPTPASRDMSGNGEL
ncbi:uncharacterized protein BROUX77_000069 [Berkeleyomyces rouxiae]|uniref:uncharacterized protein n=1 Tax=Berkeleyomyces rouxiae TaxID=2035830 RepID=UPI003B7BF4E5